MPLEQLQYGGFVGFIFVGLLQTVIEAAFGQLCGVQQIFERMLIPQLLNALRFGAVVGSLRAFNSFR